MKVWADLLDGHESLEGFGSWASDPKERGMLMMDLGRNEELRAQRELNPKRNAPSHL